MATAETRLLTPPLAATDVKGLRAGDRVRFSGVLLTARDAAHQRLVAGIDAGQPLPIDLHGQVLYYVGPTPPRPGMVIGAAGPTTGGRMDAYASKLMALGLKGMIGKGSRSRAVREAIPGIVINDVYGNDLYEDGRSKYAGPEESKRSSEGL